MRSAPKFWHQPQHVLGKMLVPCSIIYALANQIHQLATWRSRLSVPVISVGNVIAGGAGKTPTVITIAQLLKMAGFTPHILSRGYGVSLKEPLRVDPSKHTARDVGDEALLLAACAPTWVYPNRVMSGKCAIDQGADVLVCDDALQHYRLYKDISILVMDGTYGLGNGRLIPAGPMRESLSSSLSRSDAVVFIGEDKQLLRPRIPLGIPIFHAEVVPVGEVSFLHEKPVIAFAGIARPEKFFASLTSLGVTPLETYSFADHHPYSDEEMRRLFAEASAKHARLVTTEKDWVRLSDSMRRHCHSLKVHLRFSKTEAMAEWLIERLYRCGAKISST